VASILIGLRVDVLAVPSGRDDAVREPWLCDVLADGRTTSSFPVDHPFCNWLSEKLIADVLANRGGAVIWKPIGARAPVAVRSLAVRDVDFRHPVSQRCYDECTALLKWLPHLKRHRLVRAWKTACPPSGDGSYIRHVMPGPHGAGSIWGKILEKLS